MSTTVLFTIGAAIFAAFVFWVAGYTDQKDCRSVTFRERELHGTFARSAMVGFALFAVPWLCLTHPLFRLFRRRGVMRGDGVVTLDHSSFERRP